MDLFKYILELQMNAEHVPLKFLKNPETPVLNELDKTGSLLLASQIFERLLSCTC